jgi:hypothetical protein
MNTKFNTYIHVAFILYGLSLVFGSNHSQEALIYFGLALAFDPFDVNQPWKERPNWQKSILIAELVFTFLLLISSIWPDLKSGLFDGFTTK